MDHTIQMKKNTEGIWNNLYPLSKTSNIFNKQSKSLDDILNELNTLIINIDVFTGTSAQKIQQALNRARDNGGGTVYVPARNYYLDEELIIYKNTTLLSVQGAKFIREHDGYIIMNGVRGANYDKYTGQGNIKIINGEFDGTSNRFPDNVGSNIVIAHADTVLLDNVTVTNANTHHLELNSSTNVVIRNCKFLGQLPTMLYVEAIQLDLSSEAGFNAFGSHDNTPCKNIHIHDNVFGASNVLPAISRAIGTHATRVGAFMENVTIENNVFDGMRDFSIQLLSYDNCKIINNTFKGCVGGIILYPSDPDKTNNALDVNNIPTTNVQPTKNTLIANNLFTKMSGKTVIYSYGIVKSRNQSLKIINNIIKDCFDISGLITLKFTDNFEVTGNLIENNANVNPIEISESTSFKVSDNTIVNALNSTGMLVKTGIRNAQIINNYLTKIGGNGINVYDDVQNVTISNNIINGVNGLNQDYHAIHCHSIGSYLSITNNVINSLTDYIHVNGIHVSSAFTIGMVANNMSSNGTDEKYVYPTITNSNNI